MSAKEVFAGLGGLLIFGALLLVGVAIGAVFIFGSAWASSKLVPWFSLFTWIGFGLVVFVFLPLAIPRATRGFSSIALSLAQSLET